jgi:hypothetical protein
VACFLTCFIAANTLRSAGTCSLLYAAMPPPPARIVIFAERVPSKAGGLPDGMPQAGMVVTAADLAGADIVLTNYDVLRRDVNFEIGESGLSRHNNSKYPVFPTPLTRLTWWRVIVDEAQMIKGANAKAAQMASHLKMVNRWCVTGTPISKGLDDVYGLVKFLQVRLAP